MTTILVTGGGGYAGCVLVPKLLAAGHAVKVLDTFWFASQAALPDGCQIIAGDVRDRDTVWSALRDVDTVIHLAAVANDPCVELNPELGHSVNFGCFEPLASMAKERGVRRFIYASTSSVYGVSDAPQVTEDTPLLPISDYNRFKAACEPLLLALADASFEPVVVRPATLCGYSPRQRLDLVLNILTTQAVNSGTITVLGGDQQRPNLHIQDMAELYLRLVDAEAALVAGQTFNAGARNLSVSELAWIVKRVVDDEYPERPITIRSEPSNDPRSYRISSAKLERVLGWRPRRTEAEAVHDLCQAFKAGRLPNALDDDRYYNVRRMQALGLSA